ncbi:zinc finger protein 678-like [Belonocnema kinseyi]|uniref:zinc finger protein 678-like n=1 Tax=Belonocnema kinseyi TaxID=2817044 RepID=UPI00143D0CE2|nr:zinc finger protein 678-like [Belonocnema kinseyi]
MIEIVYSNDEALEVKEEIFEDQETTRRNYNQQDESNCCTIDVNETETQPEKTYKCKKCARNYKWKKTLIHHQKFECYMGPQFSCKFCGQRFKENRSLKTHIDRVNHKISSNRSILKHKCDRCLRSYNWFYDLTRHKRFKHAAVMPQLSCNFCEYKSNRKATLSGHITKRHLNLYYL